MKINASVGRAPKKIDLRSFCAHLKLDAHTNEDGEFLAWLYWELARNQQDSIRKAFEAQTKTPA